MSRNENNRHKKDDTVSVINDQTLHRYEHFFI